MTDARSMIINPLDNVEIREDGHKYALREIAAGENVIKYGLPIGHATCTIKPGEHVHVHNVKTKRCSSTATSLRSRRSCVGPRR